MDKIPFVVFVPIFVAVIIPIIQSKNGREISSENKRKLVFLLILGMTVLAGFFIFKYLI